MSVVRLIYCQGGNRRSMAIARSLGWASGVRSDGTIYDEARPLTLLDVQWERYDWERHREIARRERPLLVVVPDVLTSEALPLALEQAEELAASAQEAVLLVPKASGLIQSIPSCLGGRAVRLAYSVPTRYGGAAVPLWEFGRRPVHLLGGGPAAQIKAAHYLNTISADGNMCWKVAVWGIVYEPNGKRRTVQQIDGQRWPADGDLPYEALRRSLMNIPQLWRRAGFDVAMEAVG